MRGARKMQRDRERLSGVTQREKHKAVKEGEKGREGKDRKGREKG